MEACPRQSLNNRFIRVYRALEARGEIINYHPDKNKSEFARKVLGNSYGHIVDQYLTNNRQFPFKHIENLCKYYGVSSDYMYKGKGPMFESDCCEEEGYATPEGAPVRDGILFTTATALANQGVDVNSFRAEQFQYFSLPDVKGSGHVAFTVEGPSMEPLISSGDVVVCQPIEDIQAIHAIKDNQIYAIQHNGQLWIKHVRKITHKGRLTHLELISANYLDHPPFVEEVNTSTRLFKVVKRLVDFKNL